MNSEALTLPRYIFVKYKGTQIASSGFICTISVRMKMKTGMASAKVCFCLQGMHHTQFYQYVSYIVILEHKKVVVPKTGPVVQI